LYETDKGHRFNPNKVLLDPYAKAIGRAPLWHSSLFGYRLGDTAMERSFDDQDSAPYAALGRVESNHYDWKDDRPPAVPWSETIIYETHVRGISIQHPDVPDEIRGTYAGLASKPIIEHLTRLGITTVQLLPVHAKFSEHRLVQADLVNYWGYNTLSYFAPEPSYAASDDAVSEFKTMVRTLHAAGFEVVIDVVYNHTAEGNNLGPTLSFRGIDNLAYYKEQPDAPGVLVDYTGTGNTLDVDEAAVLHLIMDSLRYWVEEMHVDGFRFDLAVALAREPYEINMLSKFFQVVQQDPVLSRVKLIAEPWDIGPGGYQVGSFPWQWTEWNGKYRDGVRQFWSGDTGLVPEMATRVAGSSDLYAKARRKPSASINFITAHDGFTLEDLVSYTKKRNEANLEHNRDGDNHNHSTNCGIEGPTLSIDILAKRETLKRSYFATLMLSQGVPMMLGGDELSRTQHGNNNAYCQDNPVSWYDWELDERKIAFLEFARRAVEFRRLHPSFRRHRFLNGNHGDNVPDVHWWHPEGRELTHDDWHSDELSAFGMLLSGAKISNIGRPGEVVIDKTYLILFNPSGTEAGFRPPGEPAGSPEMWTVVLASDGIPLNTRYAFDETIGVPSGSLLVLEV
jgi:glycogen operon protein